MRNRDLYPRLGTLRRPLTRSASVLLAGLATSTGLLAATFQVTHSGDSGAGSLRSAIVAANLQATADTIAFSIPGEGPHRIALLSELPTITAPLTIDGYSQPGALVSTLQDASNAVIMIQLDSEIPASAAAGLSVCSSDVSIRGLSITGTISTAIQYSIDAGSGCTGPLSNGEIRGNFIGIRPDGTGSLGSAQRSVAINSAAVALGGAANADRNVIFAAGSSAVLTINQAAGTRIDGNLIGTDPTGLLNRGSGAGIVIGTGSAGVLIGGLRGNLVAFNTVGIGLEGAQSGNRLQDNRYVGNARAIDLNMDGVTANDLNDADSGPNGLQNFPVLTAVGRTASGISVSGTLDRPSGTGPLLYAIDIYASRSCDASGFGPGERRVGGSLVALANGSSESFNFNLTLDEPLLVGSAMTATATDSNGSTSEFSVCFPLVATNALIVNTVNDSGSGSLRDAITSANAGPDASQIVFNIPGAGPHVLQVQSNLPTITAPLLIDGYSQPGSAANTLDDASNALIKVQLDAAAGLGGSGAGLAACSSKVSILGLSITGFGARGVSFGVSSAGAICAGSVDGRLSGSFVGIRPDGTLASNFGLTSVFLGNAIAQIGGASNAERNVLSSGLVAAITAHQTLSPGARIDGNLIGTDPSGLQDRGNGSGIKIESSAAGLLVGTERANLIAFNDLGLLFTADAGPGNNVAGNALVNTGMGIDIAIDGVTPNDPDDADSGPNNRQNFPVLQLAQQRTGGGLRVVGRLDLPQSAASNRYTIAAYESVACDPSGHGEGSIYLGSQDVALIDRSSGIDIEDFVVNLPGTPAVGAIVTTTATDPQGSTSEFSSCIAVVDSSQLLRSGFE